MLGFNSVGTICAVIVTYNGGESIKKTVNAIRGQVSCVIIVDNGSEHNTYKVLSEIKNSVDDIVFNERNMGIAFALNQGVKIAIQLGHKWILTLDQDSIADKHMVSFLLAGVLEHKNLKSVRSFSPRIINLEDSPVDLPTLYVKKNIVITSGHLISLDVFSRVGMFEEKLFIDSVDFDFCLRMSSHKYENVQCNKAILYHALGNPISRKILGINFFSTNHSPVRKYFIARNNIFILRKYITSFPAFCIWKQFGMIDILFSIIFLEKNKYEKIKCLMVGTFHGVLGKYKN